MNQKQELPLTSMSINKRIDAWLAEAEAIKKIIGQCPIHNFGYREHAQIEVVKKHLTDIQRSVGGCGPDFFSSTIKKGDWKSRYWDKKPEPTIEDWPCHSLDMSKTKDANNIIRYDALGCALFRRGRGTPVANFFIGPDHIKKIKPYLQEKIDNYVVPKKGKQEILIKLQDILKYVDEKDVLWFRHGEKVETMLL